MLPASALGDDLASLLGQVGPIAFYLIVWGLVFVGTALFVGAFIPFITGDSLLFASGIIAASASGIDIWILVIGIGLAAFLSDQVGFVLGRHYGRPFLYRRGGPRTRRAVERTERFYELYGWWSVVVARFIPWARVFVPVIAGVGGMAYLRFVWANLLGAVVWGIGLTVTGYYAASIPEVKVAAYVIAGVFIVASIVAGVHAWRLDRKQPAELSPSN